MKFIVRNQAKIPNKYIRFAKWKILKLSRKYTELVYSEIYIKKESSKHEVYACVVKMGIPGPDIIVSGKSDNLRALWSDLSAKIKRQLRKHAARK